MSGSTNQTEICTAQPICQSNCRLVCDSKVSQVSQDTERVVDLVRAKMRFLLEVKISQVPLHLFV